MDKPLISVLIPERSRPEMLERCIASLLETAGDDHDIEVLIAVDKDDPCYQDHNAPKPWERFRFGEVRVQAWLWDRPMTLGEKLNMMGEQAGGDILWFIANDYVMETPGWPAKFRAACARLPNGIGVPFPHDHLHPDHAAFPIITRATRQATGFFMPPCFPYWFIDTAWDQLGILLGERFEIDVTVRAPEGRGTSHGLYELEFWARFFQAMAPIRLQEGIRLIEAAYGRSGPKFDAALADISRRQQICAARVAHLSSPQFLAEWGSKSESPPSPRYPEVKAYAERMMQDLERGTPRRLRVAIGVPSGRTWEATTATCIVGVACYSALAGVDCCLINVSTSMITHGRNTTVQMAMDQKCDKILWLDSDMRVEADLLINLLKCNKSIVGATYHKRVEPYTLLGRLKGPAPEHKPRGGLHEAEFLPGGVLLVDMAVYKATKWPWYFEAYRWDASDNSASFRAMMLDYFTNIPPDDALDEFADTKLGQWMAQNCEVGVDGGSLDRMTSEDINWCKKAKRAGFSIWCSLDETFRVGHIGEKVITSELPPADLKEAAD